ncbi:MAG TPA: hypothetical protein VF329_12230 [Gammaproteobacteria bacterium]
MAAHLGWPPLADGSIDLAALGAAYLAVIANVIIAAGAFAAARRFLVVSPNKGAKDYALYACAVLTVMLAATVLENEVQPPGAAALPYAGVPQLLALLALHAAAYRRTGPASVTLAASGAAGAIGSVAIAAAASDAIRAAHWAAALALALLLWLLARRSVSTKRAYVRSASIYVESKEAAPAPSAAPSGLGWRHIAALAASTAVLAVLNRGLRVGALGDVRLVAAAADALLLLGATAAVCAIPAAAYWLVKRAWLPELTRFVWLVWLVVGFTFTYGSYLERL